MLEPIDTIEQYGLFPISETEYKGNFTIKYYSKEELNLLQSFFGVRRFKFDMKLLEKREELKDILEWFAYEEDIDY